MPAPQNLIRSFLLAIADRQSEKGEKRLVQSTVFPQDKHKYALAKCYTKKVDMDTDSNQTEKEQQWQKMADHFAHITDKLGKRIDAGILDIVIVLNLLGIHTRQSCEGHLEWGTGSPWVDLEVPGLDDEEQVVRDALKEAQKQKEQGHLSQEDIKQLFQAARRLRTVVKHKHLEGRRKVMAYLAAFYDQRSIPYDVRLIIQAQGMGRSRIESQGADLQDTAPLDNRQQKLQEYQEEMQSFTAFLKEVWFSGREAA